MFHTNKHLGKSIHPSHVVFVYFTLFEREVAQNYHIEMYGDSPLSGVTYFRETSMLAKRKVPMPEGNFEWYLPMSPPIESYTTLLFVNLTPKE